MQNTIYGQVEKILGSDVELELFAVLNDMTVEAARAVLERMLEKPELEPEFRDYIFSDSRSEDFKGYTAGESKGYQRGHESGFAKGALLGCILGGALVLGAVICLKRG